VVSGPKFTKHFSPNPGGKFCGSNSFPILDISVHSGDIRAQSRKGSENGPNLAGFSPQNFFGDRPQMFGPAFVN